MKKVRLILLGESMPADRYFYDLNTEYGNRGLRYTLKKEFDILEIDDGLFLESFCKKGIVIFDCALCPLHCLDNNAQKRQAATHCFLYYNIEYLNRYPDAPIATIFPKNRGFLKSEIPKEILSRIKDRFRFSDQTGLRELYEAMKTTPNKLTHWI